MDGSRNALGLVNTAARTDPRRDDDRGPEDSGDAADERSGSLFGFADARDLPETFDPIDRGPKDDDVDIEDLPDTGPDE